MTQMTQMNQTTRMSCRAVLATLDALHDDELTIDEQVEVEAHLARCPACASHRDELTSIQTLLRSAASRPDMGGPDDEALGISLAPAVDGAVAELRAGWSDRLGRTFRDSTRVWIPSGALAVTFASAVVLAAILTLLTPTDSTSLARVLEALASPGSNENPVTVTRGVTLPHVSLDAGLHSFLSRHPRDVVGRLTLAAVVTREGEVAEVRVLRTDPRIDEFEVELSRLASDIRFKPARYAGSPVAVSVVWLVEQTTVRPVPRLIDHVSPPGLDLS